ncbi:MAG TPA: hypothetical protein VFZ08_04415 [Terriglobia bacterium]|nr:hypothetical protein [Terriglobia bacterium]
MHIILCTGTAPPKLVTLNNALLSAMHPDGPPDLGRERQRFGAWVDNACLAFAVNEGQRRVDDPRFYQCWAGCTKEMIREALGCPIRYRQSA